MKKGYLAMSVFAALLTLSCSEESVTTSINCAPQLGDSNAKRCTLIPDPGPCKALIKKYYYDQTEQKCKEFIWGGCQGEVPFNTFEECETCKNAGGVKINRCPDSSEDPSNPDV